MIRFLLLWGLVVLAINFLLAKDVRIPWIGKLPCDYFIEYRGIAIAFPLITTAVSALFLLFFLRR